MWDDYCLFGSVELSLAASILQYFSFLAAILFRPVLPLKIRACVYTIGTAILLKELIIICRCIYLLTGGPYRGYGTIEMILNDLRLYGAWTLHLGTIGLVWSPRLQDDSLPLRSQWSFCIFTASCAVAAILILSMFLMQPEWYQVNVLLTTWRIGFIGTMCLLCRCRREEGFIAALILLSSLPCNVIAITNRLGLHLELLSSFNTPTFTWSMFDVQSVLFMVSIVAVYLLLCNVSKISPSSNTESPIEVASAPLPPPPLHVAYTFHDIAPAPPLRPTVLQPLPRPLHLFPNGHFVAGM